jgi:manganese/zinc/iron transport system ATP- binding protein
MKSDVAIAINNLTVSYRQRPVLRSITAKIPAGKLLAILGPNGAGKSTLVKAILGLIPKDSGEILVLGESDVKKFRTRIAYIPQKEQIDWDFPVIVRDVVAMGRYHARGWFAWLSADDRRLIEQAMQEVGISDFADKHIRLLSGGQQQRVFIARALVQQSDILFMDEPFVGVDATTQNAIFVLIEKLKAAGKTIIMINHDLSILKKFDRLMLINKGLIAMGAPEEVYTEANLQKTYGGQMTIVDQAETTLWQAKL